MEDNLIDYIKRNKEDLPLGYADIKLISFDDNDFIFSDTSALYGGIRQGIGRFYKPMSHITSLCYES